MLFLNPKKVRRLPPSFLKGRPPEGGWGLNRDYYRCLMLPIFAVVKTKLSANQTIADMVIDQLAVIGHL